MSEAYPERLWPVLGGNSCRSLHVAELGNLRERFDYAVDTRGFDISAMGRLFAPKVLPDSVRKGPVSGLRYHCERKYPSLYETELGNHLAGMVMEPTVYREMKESIGMEKDEPYYNSGVLLYGPGGMEKPGCAGAAAGILQGSSGQPFACDQDTINGALRGRIMTLPVRYNLFYQLPVFQIQDPGVHSAVHTEQWGRTDTGRRERPCHHPLSGETRGPG